MIYLFYMGDFILNVLIGLVIMAIGISMAWKTEWYLRMIGRSAWAETNLGDGGTRLLYKLIGIAGCIIGIIIVTDLWDNFLMWILGSLIR